MDFNFFSPIRVISGRGCIQKNASQLKNFGNKAFLITGKSSAAVSGALDDVTAALRRLDIEWQLFDGISANPLLSRCEEAGILARAFGASFIIAIGGGSVLDGAKAAAVYCTNEDIVFDEIYSAKDRNRALPVVAIGTTAGTGSEIGRVAVLSHDESGRKKSIAADDLYPALTFADPGYTDSMPFSVTVSTALDALSHAMEGYFSPKCGEIPTLFALRAVELIWKNLCVLAKTNELPDEQMRDELYYGSLHAGITLAYCGTAFPHPLGYVLTEMFDVPHGFACAAFAPALLERAKQFESEKLNELLKIMGCDLEEAVRVLKELTNLQEIHMTSSEIEIYCRRWELPPANFIYSPGSFTQADAQVLLTKMFHK